MLNICSCLTTNNPEGAPRRTGAVAIGQGGIDERGLIEFATAVESLRNLDDPEKIRRLVQTKFNNLTIHYLRQLPEYKRKRVAIRKRAATKRQRIRSNPTKTPRQKSREVAEVDTAEVEEVEQLDQDPDLLAKALKITQQSKGSDFYVTIASDEVALASVKPNGLVELADQKVWKTDVAPIVTTTKEVHTNEGDTYVSVDELASVINHANAET